MSFFQAIISGIVQGITEFLPVSSSGHLVILHKLIGLSEPQIFFDIFLHLGSLLAVFIVFWKDIVEALTVKRGMILYVLLGSVVTIIIVLVFKNKIESAFSSLKAVGIGLIITGIWLILGNFIRLSTEGLSWVKAVFIGLAQGIASMPGISRSGATISTGLFFGLDGEKAAKFSFLLSIPAIIGAFLFKIKDPVFTVKAFSINYLIGFIVSCLAGILSLKLLLNILYRNKFHLFGIYCILAGSFVLLFLR